MLRERVRKRQVSGRSRDFVELGLNNALDTGVWDENRVENNQEDKMPITCIRGMQIEMIGPEPTSPLARFWNAFKLFIPFTNNSANLQDRTQT